VHLAEWPAADHSIIDDELAGQMALVRRLVELGRSARASAVVKVRQPLSRALIAAPGFATLPAELRAQVAEELNVRVLEPLNGSGGELVRYSVKANFRALGQRFGNATQAVAAAIAAADPTVLAGQLSSAAQVELQADGETFTIGPDDVTVTQTPLTGWAVASDGGETVALEVTITAELRREGLAREFVRLAQDARKADGLDISDRIALRWSTADPEVAAALTEHRPMISAEVLAIEFRPWEHGDVATEPADVVTPHASVASTQAEAQTAQAEGHTTQAQGQTAETTGPGRRHESSELSLTFWIRPISGIRP
jgi:isoleucyl-tRNA synthetase